MEDLPNDGFCPDFGGMQIMSMETFRAVLFLLALASRADSAPNHFVPLDLPGVGLVWRASRAVEAAVAAGCVDGTADARACVVLSPNGSLVHIRVPHVAGAAIEAAVARAGLLTGKVRHEAGLAPQFTQSDVGCVPWHRPPQAYVPGSFAVVRNAYERTLGILCQGSSGYDVRNTTLGCTALRKDTDRLFLRVRKGVKSMKPGELGVATACSTLSQWTYLRHAEWIFTLEKLSAALPVIASRYGIRNVTIDAHTTPSLRCPEYMRAGACADSSLVDGVTRWEGPSAFAFLDGAGFPRAWTEQQNRTPKDEPQFMRQRALDNPASWRLDPERSYERCPANQALPRIVWIYWGQGWNQAPPLCRAVVEAWRAHHPTVNGRQQRRRVGPLPCTEQRSAHLKPPCKSSPYLLRSGPCDKSMRPAPRSGSTCRLFIQTFRDRVSLPTRTSFALS